MSDPLIILFDGHCVLCNRTVDFIIRRDPDKLFKFGSLQSESVKQLLEKNGVQDPGGTILLLNDGQVLMKSTAVLNILRRLKSPYRYAYVFIFIPRIIRDFVYNFIARNRYRFFGKNESCRMPTPDILERFI